MIKHWASINQFQYESQTDDQNKGFVLADPSESQHHLVLNQLMHQSTTNSVIEKVPVIFNYSNNNRYTRKHSNVQIRIEQIT